MRQSFSYGSVSSEIFKIEADRETHHILPPQRKYAVPVTGRDGYIDFGIGGYDPMTITFDIYFTGHNFSELRAMQDEIMVWLSNAAGAPKQLSFHDRPNRYWLGKMYGALDLRNSQDHKIGTLTFECNPPWAFEDEVELSPEYILWNTAALIGTQYSQTFTVDGAMRISVNTAVQPVIKLYGHIPAGLTLTYGAQAWTYAADLIHDSIIIDCDAMTVTRGSDGANLYPYVDEDADDFFSFAPGKIEIDVAGVAGAFPDDVTVIVEVGE